MTFKPRQLFLLSLLWPAFMVALGLASPGSGTVPVATNEQAWRRTLVTPVSDEQGSTVYVSGSEVQGQASVFWQTPTTVQVQMTVEIAPDAAKAGTAKDEEDSEATFSE